MVIAELFNALYLFKCMQSSGLLTSRVEVIVIELFISIYHHRNQQTYIQRVKQELVKSGNTENDII